MILPMTRRRRAAAIGLWFENVSRTIPRWTGSTYAFGGAFGVIIVWAVVGPVFHFSDMWQLVINPRKKPS